jgi:hypothetical protein
MKIRCKHYGEYFTPDDETLELISEGRIERNTVNTCDDCFEMLRNPIFDESEMISDPDPGL